MPCDVERLRSNTTSEPLLRSKAQPLLGPHGCWVWLVLVHIIIIVWSLDTAEAAKAAVAAGRSPACRKGFLSRNQLLHCWRAAGHDLLQPQHAQGLTRTRVLHFGTYMISSLSPPRIGWRAFVAAFPPPLNAITCRLQGSLRK